MTEETGFPDEPTFSLAALAGQEQLQERIRTLENERDGKVLVDAEDLRTALGYAAHFDVADDPAIMRLTAIAGMATDGAPDGSGAANSPGRVSQDPGERTGDYSAADEHETDPRLVAMLRAAGGEWGPLGVAVAAMDLARSLAPASDWLDDLAAASLSAMKAKYPDAADTDGAP
jgi:hypothetical protein